MFSNTQKTKKKNTSGECSGAGNVWQRDKASRVIESRTFHEQIETNMSLKEQIDLEGRGKKEDSKQENHTSNGRDEMRVTREYEPKGKSE